MRADIAGNPLAGHPADARADLLNCGHQRIAEQHYPGHTVAKLGTNLGISRNATGVVIRRTGDQTRAEPSEKPPPWSATSAPITRYPRSERMRDFLGSTDLGTRHVDLIK